MSEYTENTLCSRISMTFLSRKHDFLFATFMHAPEGEKKRESKLKKKCERAKEMWKSDE